MSWPTPAVTGRLRPMGAKRRNRLVPHAEVLPYFKRCETWEQGASAWRGDSGPVGTEYAKTKDPIFDAWIEAARAVGLPVTDDYNGPQPIGFSKGQYTIRKRAPILIRQRIFSNPHADAPNLTVHTQAHATRVVMDGTTATGIEYLRKGKTVTAQADKEVILSGGVLIRHNF